MPCQRPDSRACWSDGGRYSAARLKPRTLMRLRTKLSCGPGRDRTDSMKGGEEKRPSFTVDGGFPNTC